MSQATAKKTVAKESKRPSAHLSKEDVDKAIFQTGGQAAARAAGASVLDLTAMMGDTPATPKAFTAQQILLVELGTGGLATLKAYVAEYGHSVPDTVIEPVREFWYRQALFKKGVTDPSKADKKQNQQALGSARAKLQNIRYAVKGYSDTVTSVTEAASLGKPGGNTRSKPTERQKMQRAAKLIAKLMVKDRTPEEKTFLEQVAIYVATIQ